MTPMEIFLIVIIVSMSFIAGFMLQHAYHKEAIAAIYHGEVANVHRLAEIFIQTIKTMEQAHLDYINVSDRINGTTTIIQEASNEKQETQDV